jgi:eukaryotic-like serine/threonine-protein kinase
MPDDVAKTGVQIGDTLVGKYRVEAVIGTGGMGVVVRATHLLLKDKVAVKYLRWPGMADDETIARFLREAQAAARIKSPHVARVVDVGTLDNGSPYLVMELLDGSDLGGIVEKDGPLPIEFAVTLMLQTCEALASAHASGVIHRDIKPSNLFLTRGPAGEPVVKVLDFGISKVTNLSASSGDLTLTQRSMGSPLYMSPEQMRSARNVDVRTDIWSLGVVFYELVTGVAPFVAETIPELYALVLDEDSRPSPLGQHGKDLPPGLDDIVQRCLCKGAQGRYPNVAALAAALAPFGGTGADASAERTRRILEAAGLPTVSSAPTPPSESSRASSRAEVQATPVRASSTATSFGQTGSTTHGARGRMMALVGSGLALLVGIGIGVSMVRRGGETALPNAPVPASANTAIAASPAASRSETVDASSAVGVAPADRTPPASSASSATRPPPKPARTAAPSAAATVVPATAAPPTAPPTAAPANAAPVPTDGFDWSRK